MGKTLTNIDHAAKNDQMTWEYVRKGDVACFRVEALVLLRRGNLYSTRLNIGATKLKPPAQQTLSVDATDGINKNMVYHFSETTITQHKTICVPRPTKTNSNPKKQERQDKARTLRVPLLFSGISERRPVLLDSTNGPSLTAD